jgi:hypothetical protein
LPGLTGGPPEDRQSNLIRLYQDSLVGVPSVQKEVDVASGLGGVGLKLRIQGVSVSEGPGLYDELERPGIVPLLGRGVLGAKNGEAGQEEGPEGNKEPTRGGGLNLPRNEEGPALPKAGPSGQDRFLGRLNSRSRTQKENRREGFPAASRKPGYESAGFAPG